MNQRASHSELSRALFNAFETGDEAAIRSICHDDLKAYQNLNPAMSLDNLVQFSLAVKAVVPDFHYENITCSETTEGFVEEHDVRGTLPDGSEFLLRACVVATVENGQLVELREYVDTAAAQKLLAALAA